MQFNKAGGLIGEINFVLAITLLAYNLLNFRNNGINDPEYI